MSLLAVATVASSGAQSHKWWQDERFQKSLALSPDQIGRVNSVFEAAMPSLRAQKRALDKLEDELSKMVREARVEEREVEEFVVRVEAARADLSKTRTLMLFRMHRILSADQNVKLDQMFAQAERERRPKGRGQK
ncbi:MAG TPA: periplasmic heavy metal sensor [Vicinamibacterales bacterium]|nr:periplasmic heavy metal sensor [Vicinamibacterales bacterium]